jgi:hypothetical protein
LTHYLSLIWEILKKNFQENFVLLEIGKIYVTLGSRKNG